eukprot:650786-Prymnesium_polylepis.2
MTGICTTIHGWAAAPCRRVRHGSCLGHTHFASPRKRRSRVQHVPRGLLDRRDHLVDHFTLVFRGDEAGPPLPAVHAVEQERLKKGEGQIGRYEKANLRAEVCKVERHVLLVPEPVDRIDEVVGVRVELLVERVAVREDVVEDLCRKAPPVQTTVSGGSESQATRDLVVRCAVRTGGRTALTAAIMSGCLQNVPAKYVRVALGNDPSPYSQTPPSTPCIHSARPATRPTGKPPPSALP